MSTRSKPNSMHWYDINSYEFVPEQNEPYRIVVNVIIQFHIFHSALSSQRTNHSLSVTSGLKQAVENLRIICGKPADANSASYALSPLFQRKRYAVPSDNKPQICQVSGDVTQRSLWKTNSGNVTPIRPYDRRSKASDKPNSGSVTEFRYSLLLIRKHD